MKRRISFALALACLIALPMSVQAQVTDTAAVDTEAEAQAAAAQQSLISTLEAQGNFTVLVDALKRTGLAEQLSTMQNGYTLFAPTDAAFSALPQRKLQQMSAEQWTSILRAHVVPQTVTGAQLSGMKSVTTAAGSSLEVSSQAGSLMVEGATVVTAGLQTQNGVVHAIDTVLMPSGGATASSGSDYNR